MNYAYIRVSTDTQTVKNQKLAIKQYAKYHRIHNLKFISETVSGTKSPEKRKLGSLLEIVQSGDLVIMTELSRLGRSLMMILDTLQYLLDKNVKVIAIKEGYELGDNIQSKVLAFAFGLSAEIERTLISERTKLGIERARKEGKQIGRPYGLKPRRKLQSKISYIKKGRAEGKTKAQLARELGCSWHCLHNFMKLKKIP